MKTLIVYSRRCHDVAESLLWINKMVRPSPFQSICDLLAHTFSTNSIPATAKIPIIGRPRIEKQVECRRLVDGVHEVSKAFTSQKMVLDVFGKVGSYAFNSKMTIAQMFMESHYIHIEDSSMRISLRE